MSNKFDPNNRDNEKQSNGSDSSSMCTNRIFGCDPNRTEVGSTVDFNGASPSPHLIEGSSYNGSDNIDIVLDPSCGAQDRVLSAWQDFNNINNDMTFPSSHASLELHQEERKLEKNQITSVDMDRPNAAGRDLHAFLPTGLEPAPLAPNRMRVVSKVKVVDNSWYHESFVESDIFDALMGTLQRVAECDGTLSYSTKSPHSASRHQTSFKRKRNTNKVSDNRKKRMVNTSVTSSTTDLACKSDRSKSSSDDGGSTDDDEHQEDDESSRISAAPQIGVSDDDDDRPESWQEKFQQLVQYKQTNGHCNPPQNSGEDADLAILANWVKRQRYHYKLKQQGKYNNLTTQRENALSELGFIWDIRSIAWEDKVDELRTFIAEHGHANVPVHYEKSRELGLWIKRQRRQYKLYITNNKRTSMTAQRIAQLEAMGFKWNARRGRKKSISK